ncbi:MAG: DUF2784 family protein [Proteobacteria bacterium]|nr:DUF2784 family protein [Pseudomonadota bacterium]NIS72461.1 DUF2784 family protein [Pseudomonadota bacterium]
MPRHRMYAFLDKFFVVFHSALIVFSLCGWLWKKTRVANLAVLGMIGFSWFGLGIWYGFGFCPSTDWHWQIRMKLGHDDMPNSYTKFLVDSVTGLEVNATVVDIATLVSFILALSASLLTNARHWREK